MHTESHPTPSPAPERLHRPALPPVGTYLRRGPHGTWLRDRVAAAPAGVPVLTDWLALDLSGGLYDRCGVVVLDGGAT